MKTQKPLYIAIVLLFSISQQAAFANDNYNLGDDIEKPDTLLEAANPDKKETVYGEDNIVISGDGAKQNDIIKPDPILNTVKTKTTKPNKDIELKSESATEKDKSIEHDDQLLKTTIKKDKVNKSNQSDKQNDLEMPDPLLDNVN